MWAVRVTVAERRRAEMLPAVGRDRRRACLGVSVGQQLGDILRHPSDGARPDWRGRSEIGCQRRGDTADTLPRFVEVSRGEGAVGQQIEHEPVDQRSDRLHQVGGERVAARLVGVENTESRVEPDDPGGERRLALEHGVQVVQECVRGVRREAWRSGQW
jgi:hypothetical protein